jgi:hypothetical protein
MHIQIVNFHLNELSDAEFRGSCDELAPAFADVPELISKVWLANPPANTYGGVYTWASREAMEAFGKSELFASVANNPMFEGITSTDFDVSRARPASNAGWRRLRSEPAGIDSPENPWRAGQFANSPRNGRRRSSEG